MKLLSKAGLIFIVHCFVAVFSGNAQNKITSYQYWFDNEYNTNERVSVTPAEQVNLTTLIPLENMRPGLHIISIRFRDSNGKWSIPVNQYFYASKTNLQDNEIVGYRYWLDSDIDNSKYVSLGDPVQLLNLNEDLDFSALASGEYVIHFQFRDVSGKWSLVTSDNLTYINTSLKEVAENSIKVYPNPTTGLITIISDREFSSEATLELYDHIGRTILVKGLNCGTRQTIDLSQLTKGLYFIKINSLEGYLYQIIFLQ